MAEDKTPPTTFDDRVVFRERTHCKQDLVVREDLHVKENAILNDVVFKGDVTLKTGKELHECLDEVSTFVTQHKEKIESMLSESTLALDSFKEVVDFLNSGDANLQTAIDINVTKLGEVMTALDTKHPTIDAENLLDNAFVDGFAALKSKVDNLLEGVTDESLDQIYEIADFIGKDETGLKDLIAVNKSTLVDLSGNHYALNDKHTLLDESVKTLDTALTDLSGNHNVLDEGVKVLETVLTDLSGNHNVLDEGVKVLETVLTDLSGSHDLLDAGVKDLLELHTTLSGKHDVLDDSVNLLNTVLTDLSGNHNVLDDSVNVLNTVLTDLSGNHDVLDEGVKVLETVLLDLSGNHYALETFLADLSGNHDVLDGKHGALETTVNGLLTSNSNASFSEMKTGVTKFMEHAIQDTEGTVGQRFTIDYDNVDICGNLTLYGGLAMSGDVSIFGADTSFNVVCDEIMLDASTVDICGNLTVGGNLTVDGGIAMSGDVSIFGADTSFNVVCEEIMLDASTVDVCGNLTVDDLTVNGDLTLTNALTLSNDLTVNGDLTLANALTLTNDLTVQGNHSLSVVSETEVEGGADAGTAVTIPVTGTVSYLATDTSKGSFSLPDGTIAGQMKILIHSSRANSVSATVTPVTLGPGTTLTSDSATTMGLMLVWTGTKWWPIGDAVEWVIG